MTLDHENSHTNVSSIEGGQTVARIPVKRILSIFGVALGVGVISDILFYGRIPGLSFPVFITLILGIVLLSMHRFKGRIPKYAPLAVLPLLVFAWMVFVRAGGFVTFLNILFSVYLFGLFVHMMFQPRLRHYTFLDYLAPWLTLLIETPAGAGAVITDAVNQSGQLGKPKVAPQVLTGIFITIPVVGLFILLFASADLVFRKYVNGIFDFDLGDRLVPRLMMVLVVAFFFMGILGYLARKTAGTKHKDSQPQAVGPIELHRWGVVETTILFGSLNVLFLTFILLQLAYLFGGEQNIVEQGFTYAEYARKGFFELIAVAVLSFGLIAAAEKLLLKKHQIHGLRFKVLTGGLIAQVLIIMASAFSRLLLYENAYGFTASRFFAHIFLIWLALIFCLLLYKILWNRPESTFALQSFVSVMLLLAAINLVNMDAFVARQNVDRYFDGKKLDKEYLVGLSDDAIPEMVRLLDAKDPEVRKFVAGVLYTRHQELQKDNRHWQSKNLARQQAINKLKPYRSLLEKHKPKPVTVELQSKSVPALSPQSTGMPSVAETCSLSSASLSDCSTVTNILNSAKGRLDVGTYRLDMYSDQRISFSAWAEDESFTRIPLEEPLIAWPNQSPITLQSSATSQEKYEKFQISYYVADANAEPGTYPLIISARDVAGNQYNALVTITIRPAPSYR